MANITVIKCPVNRVQSTAPRPRLFHLRKWPDFPGYGFNLHEEKSRPGHLIGSVDIDSPAAVVKIRRDDKIIEVNGHNVLEEPHKRVVERIMEDSEQVKLLVVDSIAEQYYNDNSIWVHGRMDNIDSIECPSENPTGLITKDITVSLNEVNGNRVVNGNTSVNGHSIQYAPRLCHLALTPDYQGFGFDLQNEMDREGHLVGKIEDDSPASRSGLREGDKVVEVNGSNIENLPHSNVVTTVQEAGSKLSLLVVDQEAERYFLNNQIPIREHLVQKKENGQLSVDVSPDEIAVAGDPSPSMPALSRLCHLQSIPSVQGYGFELHARTNGHFIGPIDAGSPAELAGLHVGDEIVDIQSTNIQKMAHTDVVKLLRKNSERATLLVTNANPLSSSPASSDMKNKNAVQMRHSTPHARHCYLQKWSDFDGYGFDLYEIRKQPGPRVGVIAKGSPAEATCCKKDDYIIEINGESVEKIPHSEVIKRAGKNPTQVRLLLVDQAAKDYYKARSMRIHSGMPDVETIHCPDNRNVVTVTAPPRHIELKTRPGFSGLGFNLHELKSESGHYIGHVEPGSPAADAGMEVNDQIVEVNGKNVMGITHDEVVKEIRMNPNALSLVLVSAGSKPVFHSNALWVNTDDRLTVLMVPREHEDQGNEGTVVSVDEPDSGETIVLSPTAPRPRLCKLQRWADFSGYGFDLHEERHKVAHLIGSVEPGSPADMAGLKKADHIIEVNGHNVSNGTHHDVVEKIKQYEDHVELFVVDTDTNDYYEDNSIRLHSKLPNVKVNECPRRSSEASSDIPIPIPLSARAKAELEAKAPPMRLCLVKKWTNLQGYGFNLHDEKGLAGHFIGKVDPDSPADASGLMVNDKLIEVNDEPVNADDHRQVVSRITRYQDEVSLLVADVEADEYFRTHDLRPHKGMANITVIKCPVNRVQSTVQESTMAAESTHTTEHHHSSEAIATSTVHVLSNGVDSHDPLSLRLCTITKWSEYDGYGFNLHDERGRPGHFIGGVEPASPAEAAGLRKMDQIYEVNGSSVRSVDHNAVIQHVLENSDQVQMLVGHPDVGKYYISDNNEWPHSNMTSVERISGLQHSPASATSVTAPAVPAWTPEPTIRLCHVRKWISYEGYGFRLHDDRNKPGHFIGQMENGSPAHLAGLVKADRVVEVNGVSCKDMNHHQVVSCITANPGEVRLLVLSPEANTYYSRLHQWPHGAMPNVSRIECPNTQPGAATNGVATDNADELEVGEHNGHAYIQPDCQPVREPSPEPEPPTPEVIYRAPTPELPEPVRVPTPEPVRTPSPEHVPVAHVPTPEPVREPSPVPLRQPSPVREVNGVVETVTSTTDTSHVNSQPEVEIVEPLYDVADPIGNIEATDTNRIFIVPPPPPLPEEMNGSHIVTKETEEVHTESIVVSADHEGTMAVSDIAPAADDKISIASSIATSEGSSTAAAGYNVETAELMPETSEVAQSLDIDNANVESSSVTAINQSITVVHYEGTSQVDEGTFKSVIDVSSEQDKLETHNEQDDVTLLSKHYATDPYSCPVEAEVTTDVMTQNSGSQRSRAEDVTVSELAAPSEFNDIRSSSRQSSNSTMSDSATHYDLAVDADGDSASEEVYICDIKHDISEHQPDNHITGSELAKTHVTGGYAAAHGSVPHVSLSPHDAEEPVAQDHISESHMTEHITGGFHTESDVRSEVHVTKGVAVNEYRPPPKPVVMRIPMTSSDSNLVHGKTSDVAPIESSPEGMGGSLQDALSRVKSRKKQQARNGNMSMKDKLELFQQL